jgi:putative peptide zinc metalloprotease protein
MRHGGAVGDGRPAISSNPMSESELSASPLANQPVAAVAAPPPAPALPRLSRGVELIGRYEGSGFKEPPFIVRRRDGQVVQLPPLLYALAEEIDGRRDVPAIADAFSHRIQRQVSPDDVEMLLDSQLRRLGLVAGRDDRTVEVPKLDPLLALKLRVKVVPERVIWPITTLLRPLFLPPVMAAVVAALVGLDSWLFLVHGVSQGIRHVLYQPALLMALVAGVIIATAFHELGHATAVRYGGARPGEMGVGIYLVWPAFYTDITDAYRLNRWGRLRADVGGMYFNAVFALALGGAYALTRYEPLLLLIVLQNFAIVQQSLPFGRLDGFYIISDLTGVPDMFQRIKPVLASLVPWRTADERVTQLKAWARVAVTGYVVVVVPLIGLVLVLMLVHAPRAFATAYDSLAVRWQRVGPALGRDETGRALIDVLQMVLLVLPCAGMIYTNGRIARRIGASAWRWSSRSEPRRIALVAGTTFVAAAVAFLWWPSDAYRPIQPDERGTLVPAIEHLRHLAKGRVSATVEHGRAVDAAPVRRGPRGASGAPRTSTVAAGRAGPVSRSTTTNDRARIGPTHPRVELETPPFALAPLPTTTTDRPSPPTQTTPTQTTPTHTTPTQTTPAPPTMPAPTAPPATTPTATTPTTTAPTATTPTQTQTTPPTSSGSQTTTVPPAADCQTGTASSPDCPTPTSSSPGQ